MVETTDIQVDGWQTQKRPPMLIRKFEFVDYDQTRDFLDRLAELSEELGYHPSLQFDRTTVAVNVSALEESLSDLEVRFARQATELAEKTRAG